MIWTPRMRTPRVWAWGHWREAHLGPTGLGPGPRIWAHRLGAHPRSGFRAYGCGATDHGLVSTEEAHGFGVCTPTYWPGESSIIADGVLGNNEVIMSMSGQLGNRCRRRASCLDGDPRYVCCPKEKHTLGHHAIQTQSGHPLATTHRPSPLP